MFNRKLAFLAFLLHSFSVSYCNQCNDALGMQSGAISDAQVKASTEWDRNHAAIQGRLRYLAKPGKAGSWSARHNNVGQWLQIDLGSRYTKITGLATQGRNSYSQWVTKYKVQYSDDGANFQYYSEQGVIKEFVGNTDRETVVKHGLKEGIRARYIRFRPTAWHKHISMRVEVYGCNECNNALGMESGAISDGQVKASTEWDKNHAAIQGRLRYLAKPGKAGSWSARHNNVHQWLQIDLGNRYTKITGLATQGRNSYSQWVTKYKVQYSDDGANFQYYWEQGVIKEFVGNTDRETVVKHGLKEGIRARYIRFRPTAWHKRISMRVEVYGCNDCNNALGMQSGAISDGQVKASTEWNKNHAAIQGRLRYLAKPGKAGSWSARRNNVHQWLQIDLGSRYTKITGLATQGRNAYTQWVTKYKVQYSDEGANFQYYSEQGVIKEFVGNTDRETVVKHDLNESFRARYIRFRPTGWHKHISMRVEVYGCSECNDALGMANGAISNGQVKASTEWDKNHAAIQGRLHYLAKPGKAGSWSARHNNFDQWLQIDLGNQDTTITGLASQGRNNYGQWVTKYRVQYSDNGANFQYYTEQGVIKEFLGNTDQDTVVKHRFIEGIRARYIRFRPTGWHNHISMRVEVYGCKAISCPVLSVSNADPPTGMCSSADLSFQTSCSFKCRAGYQLQGSEVRVCQLDKTWSGTPSTCEAISCPVLSVSNADPPTGMCSSADLSFQTSCSFKCRAGYQLKGSEVRVCQLDKTWSGTPSTCEEIRCPKLPTVKYATVIPSNCDHQSMRFSSVCTFLCPAGFTTDVTAPQTVSRSLTCQLNGEWDAQAPQCHDYRSPTLSCPGASIIGDTTKGKATGKVSWNIQVTDNSVIVDPNAKINVTSTHQPSQELPIGATGVQVTASDSTGNTETCSFMVYIKDIEAPIVEQCPGDIVREEGDRQVRVHWTNPVFSDNSGNVTFSSNRQIGDVFDVPGTYEIVYTANDRSNNQNKNCSFRITLKKKTCPLYPPPKNGALACFRIGGDVTCAVMCQTGTDFEFNVPMLYFCSAGKWNFYSPLSFSSTLPWPNCKAGVNPSSSIKKWSEQYHYFDGDAHDLNVQVSIKEKFYQLLRSPIVPPFFCLSNPSSCSEQDIFVSPGIKG